MSALTFFRIKKTVADPDKIILNRNDAKLTHVPVRLGNQRIGDLYIKRVERSKPSWLKYFGSSIDVGGITLRTASLAAVLLIKKDNVFYAVVFGYGASLIDDSAIDSRFGLRATLNAVEPSKLRSISHKRIEAISRNTQEQLSRAGPLDQFGLDIDRDLLRAVTGTPTDSKTHGKRMSGADQLTVVADIPIDTLADSLKMYSELSEKTTYVANFPWVDKVKDIRDPTLQEGLDRLLAKELEKGAAKAWLSPPEIIDWNTTRGFRYGTPKRGEPYPDLDFDDYFDVCGAADGLDDGRRLQHDKIYQIRADNETGQHGWPARKCVVAEIDHNGERYILNEGVWYRIANDFLQDIEAFVKQVPKTKIDLPDFDRDASEGAYNKRAWARNKRHLSLLDTKFIRYPKHGQVEVCDLYTKDKIFVHVKRMSASSTLSHLFAQGLVSAELMLKEQGFREQFLDLIPGFQWGKAADVINPSDFEVSYAIVERPKQQLDLPFFSKVSLRAAVQNLRTLGYKVSMIAIPSK